MWNSLGAHLSSSKYFWKNKDQIEADFGCQLRWDRKDDKFTTNISLSRSLRYYDTSNGNIRDIADFFCEYFDKFYTILPKYCGFNPEKEEVWE